MNQFIELLSFIDDHFIDGIFVSVLLIIIVRKFFKSIKSQTALDILSYLMVFYCLLSIIYLFLISIVKVDSNLYASFINRATGIYKLTYILMLVAHSFLPLLLLFRKFRTKIYLVFFIALFMNLGWLFESYVIHITNFHQEYGENRNAFLPFDRELIILGKGFLLGILALIIGNIKEHRLVKN
jgi:membrane-associated HD superfamily phosphohydrolase